MFAGKAISGLLNPLLATASIPTPMASYVAIWSHFLHLKLVAGPL